MIILVLIVIVIVIAVTLSSGATTFLHNNTTKVRFNDTLDVKYFNIDDPIIA